MKKINKINKINKNFKYFFVRHFDYNLLLGKDTDSSSKRGMCLGRAGYSVSKMVLVLVCRRQ